MPGLCRHDPKMQPLSSTVLAGRWGIRPVPPDRGSSTVCSICPFRSAAHEFGRSFRRCRAVGSRGSHALPAHAMSGMFYLSTGSPWVNQKPSPEAASPANAKLWGPPFPPSLAPPLCLCTCTDCEARLSRSTVGSEPYFGRISQTVLALDIPQ